MLFLSSFIYNYPVSLLLLSSFFPHIYLFLSSFKYIYIIMLVQKFHLNCPAFFLPPHISAAVISDFLYLHYNHDRCPKYVSPLFSSAFYFWSLCLPSPSCLVSAASVFTILLHFCCCHNHTIFHHLHDLHDIFLPRSCVFFVPLTPPFFSFLYPYCCHPHYTCNILCHCKCTLMIFHHNCNSLIVLCLLHLPHY